MDKSQKFHTVRGYQLLEQNRRLLTPAMEDYLEMIYRCSETDENVRINTISEMLSVAAPSATKMVQRLNSIGMLNYKKYGIICLTKKGREIGKFLYQRHNIIETFLNNIGASENLLAETELIEHSFSVATLLKINAFNKFLEQNPDVLRMFEQFAQYNIGL